MIIKCPRCGLKISTNVESCFCCGLPVSRISLPVRENLPDVNIEPRLPEPMAPHRVPDAPYVQAVATPAAPPIREESPSVVVPPDPVVADVSAPVIRKKKRNNVPVIIAACVGFVFLLALFSHPSSDTEPVAEEVGADEVVADELPAKELPSDLPVVNESTPDNPINENVEDVSESDRADIIVDHENTNKDSAEEEIPAISTGEAQALKKAEGYLDFSAYSYDGLIHQLEYEGFSEDDSRYGADNCGADWNDQAVKKAKSYLDFSAYSYSGLKDQLIYEKFTEDQAAYGADNCGADWYDQAAKKAKSYLDTGSFSLDSLVRQLEYEGFSEDEAQYGANEAYK